MAERSFECRLLQNMELRLEVKRELSGLSRMRRQSRLLPQREVPLEELSTLTTLKTVIRQLRLVAPLERSATSGIFAHHFGKNSFQRLSVGKAE